MIDISQWRQSIGLWNYCQASSGRPSNRCSLGGDCTVGSTNKKGRRSLVLSFTVFLLFISILLSGYLNYEPHVKGVVIHCYWSKVQCTSTGYTITDSSYLQSILPGSDISSSDVFYSSVYLMHLLLLSGDVELNPGPISGNAKDIFRTHSDKLIHAISENLHNVTLALNAKGLITQQIKEDMLVPGASNYEKSSKLVNVIQQILEASLQSHQYLTELCQVLQNQQNHALRNIAASMLGQTIPDDVLSYAHNMKQYYKGLKKTIENSTADEGWKPSDYFGRLTLVEKQDYSTEAESAKYLLMGQVDKVVKLSGNKEIRVEDILQPVDDSPSLRVVIDGPPGIGKTVLCHKLLRIWCETLANQHYDLVLYCPLRNSKLATLADLFKVDETFKAEVVDWFSDRAGERLLIIFDGWDELSEQLRQSSLAASIISKDLLDKCSVIVTSRSYASSSLLKTYNLRKQTRHVQIIGFSKEEISTVIIRKLQKNTELAQKLIDKKRENDKNGKHFTTTQSNKDSQLAVKLINHLKVRNDIQSLCYVPLVCSMVSLYCVEEGHLPTPRHVIENLVLQAIRRRVEIKSEHDTKSLTLDSLSQEMCHIAYTNLADKKTTFTSQQLQSLNEADYLGLMTFIDDDKKYQFLHLSIQEFLAAWWIAKCKENIEQIIKAHFNDDHLRTCLSFVFELTGTFNNEAFKSALDEADRLQYSVSTAIVQGEAEVGKTCLKSLILSLPYENVRTSCIESPCIARYGSGDDGKSWILVTDDEIDENVIARLQDIMIRKYISNESAVNLEPIHTKSSYSAPDNYSASHQKVTHNLKQVLVNKPDVNLSVEESVAWPEGNSVGEEVPTEFETKGANDETLITATPYDMSSDNLDDPLALCKSRIIESIGFYRQWLYFFDTGGQIQFQKLLLAFMPCPSALILVINVSKNLSSDVNGLQKNEKVVKVKDMLAQMISAVASKAYQHKLANKDSNIGIKYSEKDLLVLALGTYHDKLKEKDQLEAMQEELLDILSLVSNTCNYENEKILLKIDGRIADDKPGKLDHAVTSASIDYISLELEKRAHEIDVPLRWHYFGVILRKKASQSEGVLHRTECDYYGRMLEMEGDVHNALQFFHGLGMLFYYHESPLHDIVFVKLDCLINIIRYLVMKVSKSYNYSLSRLAFATKKLRVCGKFSVKIFDSSEAFTKIASLLFKGNNNTCFDKIMSLFQHLKIAAKVQEEGQFFMPVLLPLHDIDTIKLLYPHTKSSPLLFYFENAVPMGFFCAIIVHLLSANPKNPWEVFSNKGGSFSNFCTLKQQIIVQGHRGSPLEIALVERLDCIEIYCDNSQYRLKAKDAVSGAINSVMKVLNLKKEPSPAFYCQCNDKEGEHVATVKGTDIFNSFIVCVLSGKNLELSDGEYNDYFSWFFTQQDLKKIKKKDDVALEDNPDSKIVDKPDGDSLTQCSKLNLLEMKPELSKLQLCFKSSAIHYSIIGTALDLDVRDLLHSSMAVSDRLIDVFNRWIDKNIDVTWQKILQVCDEYPNELGIAKAAVKEFLYK